MSKNTKIDPIIIFKGGGYDGCFWEWNAIFLSIEKEQLRKLGEVNYRPGKYSSPCNRTRKRADKLESKLKTQGYVIRSFRYTPYSKEKQNFELWGLHRSEKQRPRLVVDEKQPVISGRAGKAVLAAFRKSIHCGVVAAASEGEICIIKTEAQWKKFNDDFNKGFVRGIANHAQLDCFCDKCGRGCSADEIVHTGYRGDGGIGVQFDDNHCIECADELHEEWFAKEQWKHLPIKERVEAIQNHNRDCSYEVSIFAARNTKSCPVSYRDANCEPEYY